MRKVLLPQGVAMWFVSLPVQVPAVTTGDIGIWRGSGVPSGCIGMVFESVGDAQLAAYKRDPERPPVMDRGLWRYTRHPNYFGDACVWWGIWLVAADAWPGCADRALACCDDVLPGVRHRRARCWRGR